LIESLEQNRKKIKSSGVNRPRLEIHNITKTFPGVVALDDVSIEVAPGEIHAMVGENGAGKSTLMHIIAGVYPPEIGNMEIDDKPYLPLDEIGAQKAGIAMVFQEGSLFAPLSVAENVFAGRQPVNKLGMVDFHTMEKQTKDLLHDLDLDIDPSTRVSDLSPSQKQLVEIAKALSHKVRILILDEPTSSLTINEARNLFKILRRLADRDVAVIYVTHRLAEVFEVADRVTVLKDGKVTGVREIKNTTADELIFLEVGRELSFEPTMERVKDDSPVVIEIENLSAMPVDNASLKVKAGEIVCLAGLVGAGRTELCETIFGVRKRTAGVIRVRGEEINPHHPIDAMRVGIAMVTEDRRDGGLFQSMSVADNVISANLDSVSRNGMVDNRKVNKLARTSVEILNIITPSLEREVMYLSGGNQQKVLLARWLARKPEILIVDEPTRGVDVGAKSDLYTIIRELAKSGVAVLVVSSDLPEVLALAHHIVVMAEGKTVGEMDAREATEVKILQMATPKNVASKGA
jgi:ABC-type sugar transport system ATPase subunit